MPPNGADDKREQPSEPDEIETPNAEIVEIEKKPSDTVSHQNGVLDGMFPEDMPPEFRQTLSMMMGTFQGPPRLTNPLLEKLNDAHLDKYLDNLQRDSDHEYELKRSGRPYQLGFVVVTLLFVGGMIMFLTLNNSALLLDILKVVVGLIGGFGGGYGYKSYLDRKEE